MLEEAQIAEFISPYLSVMIGLIVSLTIKDFVTGFIKGIAFRLNPLFREGDLVIVDGEYAIVMKIGFCNTVFAIERENKDSTWLSVPNQRIPFLKIEKVVKGRGQVQNIKDATTPAINHARIRNSDRRDDNDE